MALSRAPAALLDLVLPAVCAACGEPGTPWCPPCRAAFGSGRWYEPAGLPPVLVLARYAGAARAAVLAYKERGRRDLARPLAEAVGHALAVHGVPPARVVPAPSRRRAARARGGDHVLRIARALCRGRGPTVARALALRPGARDSVGLDADARAANLAAHLRLRPRGLPRRDGSGGSDGPVLLLDDVLTTGATARAATALLAGAGCAPDAVVVLTAVARPDRARRSTGRPDMS